jgi:hypothetical protein
MQKQYYLFEDGKTPALVLKSPTSDLENNLENLAVIGRMEIKRAGKNPEDFYIKEYIVNDANVVKSVKKIKFYNLTCSVE